MITDKPDSAYEVCTKFAPDCSGQNSSINIARIEPSSSTFLKKGKKSKAKNFQNDRSGSLGNLGLLSSPNSLKINNDATLVSRDNSGESDGGVGFHGEEDYYDSLNSGDETELMSSRPNNSRTAQPRTEPVFNPEPGLNLEPVNIPEPGFNEYDSDTTVNQASPETDNSEVSANTTIFSTVVNGVKIKSLPGPRGE